MVWFFLGCRVAQFLEHGGQPQPVSGGQIFCLEGLAEQGLGLGALPLLPVNLGQE